MEKERENTQSSLTIKYEYHEIKWKLYILKILFDNIPLIIKIPK